MLYIISLSLHCCPDEIAGGELQIYRYDNIESAAKRENPDESGAGHNIYNQKIVQGDETNNYRASCFLNCVPDHGWIWFYQLWLSNLSPTL